MQFLKEKLEKILGEQYEMSELQNIYYLLLEEITGFSRVKLLSNTTYQLSSEEQRKGEIFIKKLANNAPIQYVIGKTEFYGLPFLVNEHVLIPRPETEELVEWILSDIDACNGDSVLDVGTGSGCIAVALKNRLKDASVSALDISEKALTMARKNSDLHKMDITFFQADITRKLDLMKEWDVIVSNPPYIPVNEKNTMSAHVVEAEPSLALFVPNDDVMLFYRSLLEFSKSHLSDEGIIYVEIHQNLTPQYLDLFDEYGYIAEIRKDLSGNDRMIKAYKKSKYIFKNEE